MNFKFMRDKNVVHFETYRGYQTFYLCAIFIKNFSFEQRTKTQGFSKLVCRSRHCTYLNSYSHPGGIEIDIKSDFSSIKKDVSIFTPTRTITIPMRDLSTQHGSMKCCASIDGEDFQKLKDLPDNTCVIVCKFKFEHGGDKTTRVDNSSNSSTYLKKLNADIRKYSFVSKEKVHLCVGKETESVNKAVLLVQSPVFAKMFESQMREMKTNEVTITDVKMPVIRAFVSYLNSGLAPNGDFDFAHDLYYAADKYDISELKQACICSLISESRLENLFKLLKLAISHNDTQLKLIAMTIISANTDTVVTTSDWKNLMLEDSEFALEVAAFFDF